MQLIEEAKEDQERKERGYKGEIKYDQKEKDITNFFVMQLLFIFLVKICISYCISMFYYDIIKLYTCFILNKIDYI